MARAAQQEGGGHPRGHVGQLRSWIAEEQPGLPVGVQNLLVICYSIQADKEWLRGGQPIETPTVARVADDMSLRGTELPTEAEFETASRRAEGIFGIAREPVRTTRSVQALADHLRRNASGLAHRRAIAGGRTRQACKDAGLDDAEQPRTVTARLVAPLLARLAATADPTQTVRVLADAELPRENAIYQCAPGQRGAADRSAARPQLAGARRPRGPRRLRRRPAGRRDNHRPAAGGGPRRARDGRSPSRSGRPTGRRLT